MAKPKTATRTEVESSYLAFSRFVLDVKATCLYQLFSSKPVTISKSLFNLLQFFVLKKVAQPERSYWKHEEILDGAGLLVSELVEKEVACNRWKSKLEKRLGETVLENVRGKGYVLQPIPR